MASAVFDLATILGALDQIDGHLGSPVEWRPQNPDQIRLLEWRNRISADVRKLRRLDCCATGDADELNRFLAGRGFASRFKPLTPPEFGAVSALRRESRWPQVGTTVRVFAGGSDHRGFRLENTATGYALAADRTLVALPRGVMDEGTVWLLLGQLPGGSDVFELFESLQATLVERKSAERQRYVSVTMPEVRLAATDDLPWLCGLSSDATAIGVTLQVADIRIDRTGREDSMPSAAAALAAPAGLVRDLVVDGPFIAFWTEDASPTVPLVGARFDLDTWSDWDSELADRENAELEAADEASRKGDRPQSRLGAVRSRLFGRK